MRKQIVPTGLIAIAVCLAGCASSPLQEAVKETLPGSYEAKQPALQEASLGHRVMRDGLFQRGYTVDVNSCYDGRTTPDGEVAGADSVVVDYSGKASGSVKDDFGGTVDLKASGSRTLTTKVELKNLSQAELSALYMDASSVCAERFREEYKKGMTEAVIIRAVRAGSVSATKNASGEVELEVKKPGIGEAQADIETNTDSTWQGTNIFFAEEHGEVSTLLEEQELSAVEFGKLTPRFGSCRAEVLGIGRPAGGEEDLWEGRLHCDQRDPVELRRPLNTAAGVETAKGVSYGMRVTESSVVGRVDVTLQKWTVLEER